MSILSQEFDTEALAFQIRSAVRRCEACLDCKDKDFAHIRSLADEGLAAVVLYNRCRDEGMDMPYMPYATADGAVGDWTDALRMYSELSASDFEAR